MNKLHHAALIGDIVALQCLVNKGTDINERLDEESFEDAEDERTLNHLGFNLYLHETPLHAAVKAVQLECVEWLLNHGAKILPDIYGRTPLHIAAKLKHYQAVELLLAAGANPNQYTCYTKKASLQEVTEVTPLEIAVKDNATEIALLMLSNRGQLNTLVKDGLFDRFAVQLNDTYLNYYNQMQHCKLTLNKLQLSKELLASLGKVITYIPIDELDFSSCDLDDRYLREHLLPLLPQANHLKVLNLYGNQITYVGARLLAAALAGHPTLCGISLSKNPIMLSQALYHKLSAKFSKCPALKQVLLDEGLMQFQHNLVSPAKNVPSSRFFASSSETYASLINPKYRIRRAEWLVSLLCQKETGKGVLYLEGIDKAQQHFLVGYALTAEGKVQIITDSTAESLDLEQHSITSRLINRINGSILRDMLADYSGKPVGGLDATGSSKETTLQWFIHKLEGVGVDLSNSPMIAYLAEDQDRGCVIS